MFLFRSRNHPTGSAALNATTQDHAPEHGAAERTARHLAMLQKLAELGMVMAEQAAGEALAAPALHAQPGDHRPAFRMDPRIVFTRLSNTIRSCIALEARLAAGKLPASPREERDGAPDPRRHAISAYIHDAIEDSALPKPRRAALHDQVEPRIDDYLAGDPGLEHAGGEIAAAICQDLDIPYTVARMADELLCPPGKSFSEAIAHFTATLETSSQGHDPP